MNVLSQIVVVSPDMESRRSLATILTRLGFDPICISTVGECRVMLAKENVGLVFCDRDLADGNYRDILVASRATKRQPGVVLTGQRHNCDENHEAIGFGVFGVTATPYHPTDVEWMVIQARRYERKRTPEAEDAGHLWEIEAINSVKEFI
jgi:DNA-binding NtrC family response regulator